MYQIIEHKFTYNFDFYSYKVKVIVSNDIIASRYKRNHIFKEMYLPETSPLGLFCDEDDFTGYIFLNYDSDIEIITHEVFHAICALMRSIGNILDESSEESFAYPMGFLNKEVVKFIKSIPNKEKGLTQKSKKNKKKSENLMTLVN